VLALGFVRAMASVPAAGCELPAAAFCETFESGLAAAPERGRGRGGELDRRRFFADSFD
jgi:hypothetical protein